MRPVQYFTDEYLEQCRDMTPDQIIEFLDDFRQLHGTNTTSKSKLISIKVPENLLNVFRAQAAREGVRYQTQVKALMKDWVLARREGIGKSVQRQPSEVVLSEYRADRRQE